MNEPLQLVYEDAHILVANKPANFLSVPGRGPEKQDCLITHLQQRFPEALSVHRLDYATSGLIIVARSKAVHRQISILFEQRKVEKMYTAVVAGLIEQETGRVELPLICDWPNRPLQKVDFESGKPSTTLYRCIDKNLTQQTTRVELTPITGRSHQLRVHMQAIGHPILGDEFYAPESIKAASSHLCLHATYLGFEHPVTHQKLALESRPNF